MGQRIVRLLQTHIPHAHVIGGSRHPSANAAIKTRVIDYSDPATFDSGLSDIDILIHAAGPFQHDPAPLVRACIARHIHYIDIAESLEFIQQVRATAASVADCAVILVPGCSTVPGLVSCLAQIFTHPAHIAKIDIRLNLGSANPLSTGLLFSLLRPLGQAANKLGAPPWFRQLFSFTHLDGRTRHYGNYPIPLNSLRINNSLGIEQHNIAITFAVGFDRAFINAFLYLASFIVPHLSDRTLLSACKFSVPLLKLFWGSIAKIIGSTEGRLTLIARNPADSPVQQIELKAPTNGLDIPAITTVWATQRILLGQSITHTKMHGCVGLKQLISAKEVVQHLRQLEYIVDKKVFP